MFGNSKKIIPNGIRYPDQDGWVRISIWGDPKARGKAYGQLIPEEFRKIQEMLNFSVLEETGRNWQYFIDAAKTLFYDKIKNEFDEFFLELEGLAEGLIAAGVSTSIDEVLAWNNKMSLDSWYGTTNESGSKEGGGKRYGGQPERCSLFATIGSYSKDGKIVLSHSNFSNFIDGQFAKQVLDITPTNGNRMLIQGFLGYITWSGTDFFVTSAGIAGSETTIGGFNKWVNKNPVSCRIRKAMQFGKTLEDYEAALLDGNSGDYANNWVFADVNNPRIMRLELGLEYHNTEYITDGYFVGFNAAYDPRIRNLECSDTGFNDIRRHQGSRKIRLPQLMEENKGNIDAELAKKLIGDHYDVYLEKENPCSRTVCSHYDEDPREFMSDPSRPLPYQPRGAVDGNVIDSDMIKSMSFMLKWGRSCDIPFNKTEFCTSHPQWKQYEPYLQDRPNQPWSTFTITPVEDQKPEPSDKVETTPFIVPETVVGITTPPIFGENPVLNSTSSQSPVLSSINEDQRLVSPVLKDEIPSFTFRNDKGNEDYEGRDDYEGSEDDEGVEGSDDDEGSEDYVGDHTDEDIVEDERNKGNLDDQRDEGDQEYNSDDSDDSEYTYETDRTNSPTSRMNYDTPYIEENPSYSNSETKPEFTSPVDTSPYIEKSPQYANTPHPLGGKRKVKSKKYIKKRRHNKSKKAKIINPFNFFA